MNSHFINVSLTDKQFLTIISALYAQINRSPLFSEEALDVCSKLTAAIVDTAFYKDKNAVR